MADTVRYVTARTGERIGYDMCFASDCLQHATRCQCAEGPTPPRVGARLDADASSVPAARPAA